MEAGPRNRNRAIRDAQDPQEDTAPLTPDGPDEDPSVPEPAPPEIEVELRPQRRLRIWQLAPIVMLAGVGSLMFAFPLAFEFGDPVTVGMLLAD